MTYFPLSDEFYSAPEFLGASDAAVVLYTRAASWSAGHLTDGHVPATALPLFTASHEKASAELVERKVWKRARGGFQFVAWPKQATRSYVEARRESWKQRQQKNRSSEGTVSRRDTRVNHTGVTRDSPGESRVSSSCSSSNSSPNGELPPSSPPTGDEFARFWSAYPRKDGKAAARKAWSKACKKLTADELIDQAQRWSALWAATGAEQRFIPHASTWLNGERWNDSEPAPCTGQQSATDANIALLLGDRSTLRALPGGGA